MNSACIITVTTCYIRDWQLEETKTKPFNSKRWWVFFPLVFVSEFLPSCWKSNVPFRKGKRSKESRRKWKRNGFEKMVERGHWAVKWDMLFSIDLFFLQIFYSNFRANFCKNWHMAHGIVPFPSLISVRSLQIFSKFLYFRLVNEEFIWMTLLKIKSFNDFCFIFCTKIDSNFFHFFSI